jgi:hypothetical protein
MFTDPGPAITGMGTVIAGAALGPPMLVNKLAYQLAAGALLYDLVHQTAGMVDDVMHNREVRKYDPERSKRAMFMGALLSFGFTAAPGWTSGVLFSWAGATGTVEIANGEVAQGIVDLAGARLLAKHGFRSLAKAEAMIGQAAAPVGANKPLSIPLLQQGNIGQMFGEMQGCLRANRTASQGQLADLFQGLARQISAAHPNWQAGRSVLADGTIVFVGRDAVNVFAIRPNGQMLQSNPAVGPLRFNAQTRQLELNYSVMRVIE